MKSRVTVVRAGMPAPRPIEREDLLTEDDFRRELRTGLVLRRLFGASEARLLVRRLSAAGRPLATCLMLRAMSRGTVWIEDAGGQRRAVTWRLLATWLARLVAEPLQVSGLLARVAEDVGRHEALVGHRPGRATLHGAPLYLRTDLSFGIRAGGSVGHTAGVLNNLAAFAGAPVFVTTDDVPTIDPGIETYVVSPLEQFWNFRELPAFLLSDRFASETLARVVGRPIGFVYHRYSLGNFSGVAVARSLGVPLVLEFNGSEVWVSDHWGRRLKHRHLALRIEQLNLAAADLIVVVSQPIADQLATAGIESDRVLVNPNGVDVERYRPDVDGVPVRRALGIERAFVVGFIGTFGAWHGADVLASAFVMLLRQRPDLRDSMRLLMIGDGARMPAVKGILEEGGVADLARLTGLVPQEQGSVHLAACDLLVSPHVPNVDGSPFFGSPTKLYEYMAMGRPIIASDLDQIGDVLEHNRTAWLVPPADVGALAAAIARLAADDDARRRLGAAARAQAVARHTWREHTRRIVDRLESIAGGHRPFIAAPSAR